GRGGRTAGSKSDPRTAGGAGDRHQGGVPRAADICEPSLSRLPPFDAALCLPALGGDRAAAGSAGTQMGAAERSAQLSDAARRRALDTAPDDAVVTPMTIREHDRRSGKPALWGKRDIGAL